jgi:hypothetical protein
MSEAFQAERAARLEGQLEEAQQENERLQKNLEIVHDAIVTVAERLDMALREPTGWREIATDPPPIGIAVDVWARTPMGEWDRFPDCRWIEKFDRKTATGTGVFYWLNRFEAARPMIGAPTHWRYRPGGPKI